MAYRADIEVAVRGARQLRELKDELNATAKAVESVNNFIENFSNTGIVRSIDTLRSAVAKAATEFNKVSVNTDEAVIAARQYIRTTDELNTALQEQLALQRQIRTEQRLTRLRNVGVSETTQYPGPIGPGAASPVALSSPLRGRTQQLLDERAGALQLAQALTQLEERRREATNAALDEKALRFQQTLDAQAAAAATTAEQTAKLAGRQKEFTARTDEAARAARALTAEYIRQQRAQLQLQKGARASTVEFGPGGPGFSGGFTPAQRQSANEQAILRIRQEENKIRRENLSILQREELFELKLQGIRERNLATEKQRSRTKEATSNAIIGGAFPLLFGQGLGASIGGGVGGAAGGALGGQLGFGLSLAGTAVGNTFDQAIISAQDFAKSLRAGGDASTYLEQRLGSVNREVKLQITNLQQSGQTSAAANKAFNELARQIGTENAQAFKTLGEETLSFSTGFQRLVTILIAGSTRINQTLSPLLDRLIPGLEGIKRLVSGVSGFAPQSSNANVTPEFAARTAELARQNTLLGLQVSLTSISAANDLERFVAIQKQIATKEYENELTKIAIQLKTGEIDLEQNKLKITAANLELSKKLGDIERTRVEELTRRQREATQAAEEAQRKAETALRAQLNAQKSTVDERLKNLDIIIQESEFTEGTETSLRRSLQLTEIRSKLIEQNLSTERELALQEAAKNGTTRQTLKLYDQKLKNAQNELNLQTAITERQIQQLQVQKELDKFQRQRRLEQDLAGLQLPGAVSPLQQLTVTQAGRRDQLLGPRFEELDQLQTKLAAPAGTFSTDQIKDYKDRLNDVNNEIGRLTNGLAEVEAAEITWERNKAGAEALETVLNGLGSTITNVFSSLINNTEDFNSSLSNALRSLSNLLLQATISGLAGTDGVGFFSFLAGGLGRRAAGGPVANRTPYIVGERGPELFVPNSSGTIVPNNQLGGMGGDVSIVVNVDASGSQVQGDESQAKALGSVVSVAVRAEIVKQQRPGGLLAGTR